MKFSFDLLSDLHIEHWPEFDWAGQATSQFCIIAGDVSRDINVLTDTLTHLSECYTGVFYIDGNDEHKNHWDNLGDNYQNIHNICNRLDTVVYLQDNIVVINGVAIIAANGWWTWDLDPTIDPLQTRDWFCNHYQVNSYVPHVIDQLANSDISYLEATISKLQTMPDVRRIVIVTHTVPMLDLISHDLTLSGNYRLNCAGNRYITAILHADIERKISHWCFGHYHMPIDQQIGNIRFVNNCRGRPDTPYYKSVYYPLRIEIDV